MARSRPLHVLYRRCAIRAKANTLPEILRKRRYNCELNVSHVKYKMIVLSVVLARMLNQFTAINSMVNSMQFIRIFT